MDVPPRLAVAISSLALRAVPDVVPFGQSVAPRIEPSLVEPGVIQAADGTYPLSPSLLGGELLGDISLTLPDLGPLVSAGKEVTGTLKAPSLAEGRVSVIFQITDDSGAAVGAAQFSTGETTFDPLFAVMPAIVDDASRESLASQYLISAVVTLAFPGSGAPPRAVELGPVPFRVPPIRVPIVAVLTRYSLREANFPGATWVAVPSLSAVSGPAEILGALEPLRFTLDNLSRGAAAAAASLVGAVGGLGQLLRAVNGAHFTKADFANARIWFDNRLVYSCVFVAGPSRLAQFSEAPRTPWQRAGPGRFLMRPGPLGISVIPDLSTYPPLTATVGAASEIAVPFDIWDNQIFWISFPPG